MTISGRHVSLRLVELSDAAFLFALRRSPRGAHLSPVADDPGAQVEWIREYKCREGRGEEYYYVVHHETAGDVGALRIHDLDGSSFWWGSWIVTEDAPRATALESMFLVYELGFFGLDRERARFAVRRDNPSLGFHRKVGAQVVGEDASRVLFELTRDRYRRVRPRLARKFAVGSR